MGSCRELVAASEQTLEILIEVFELFDCKNFNFFNKIFLITIPRHFR